MVAVAAVAAAMEAAAAEVAAVAAAEVAAVAAVVAAVAALEVAAEVAVAAVEAKAGVSPVVASGPSQCYPTLACSLWTSCRTGGLPCRRGYGGHFIFCDFFNNAVVPLKGPGNDIPP